MINSRGSTTVYLVLVFISVAVLITAVISTLRYNAEKVNSETALNLSEEAAFSKYFRPLLDNYGLYYYISDNEESLSADIMGYFIKNQEGISEVLSIRPQAINIVNLKYAMDDEAADVKRQMTDVVKDTVADNVVDRMKDRFGEGAESSNGINEDINTISRDYKEAKNEAEKEKDMLLLLKLVEGITVSGGKIKCADNYAKNAVPGSVTAIDVGIDMKDVWNAVKGKSWNFAELLQLLEKRAKKGSVGESVVFPETDVKEWGARLNKTLEVTKEAKKVAEGLAGINGGICDPEAFAGKLASNINILERLISLSETSTPDNADEWSLLYNEVQFCINLLGAYHVKDLQFDYSTLNTSETENPLDSADGDINGLLDMLIQDTSDISSASVAQAGIYEGFKGETGKHTVNSVDFEDIDDVSGAIDECGRNVNKGTSASNLMLDVYIDRYFEGYSAEFDNDSEGLEEADDAGFGKSGNAGRCHVLRYEKEYIVCANASDRENLREVIRKILFTRMGMSMLYLVSDSKSKELAYGTAVCLVGFTGLDALVRCVQYSILAAWAYEDACIDTGAVLAGKRAAPVKNKNNLNIQYNEMVLFGKKMIGEKVNSYKSSGRGLAYDDYIQLFLLGVSGKKRVYRCMDIIQFNMKEGYDKLFSFQRAIYGADVYLTCNKPFYYVAKGSYSY